MLAPGALAVICDRMRLSYIFPISELFTFPGFRLSLICDKATPHFARGLPFRDHRESEMVFAVQQQE
eukprot:3207896-Pleurochrysis_carterae.AAC.4